MEQIGLVIRENTGAVFMGCWVLTMILQAVTLHRIRKNETRMKNLADMTECTLGQIRYLVEAAEAGPQNLMSEPFSGDMQQEQDAQPEELLNAVLEEVFPGNAFW